MSISVAFFWSGGKDSACALYRIQQEYDVRCLITTISSEYRRVSMHGVREEMLDKQATATGIPLHKVVLEKSTHETYKSAIRLLLQQIRTKEGITHCAAGDIFLADVRAYREQLFTEAGMKSIFPLWGEKTSRLAYSMLKEGFSARLCCVEDTLQMYLGAEYDEQLLSSLPESVDPCGEYGEYHTYCYAGPVYNLPIAHRLGKQIHRKYELSTEKKGFYFVDILPKERSS